ncbi:hypothetical protein ACCO45_002270 [Purpureocillium lilacinum]|uniref:Uncharacterized protein n=1 Tax=Purpureocillium lilacinum TaxID=33203 RepID=A0ACC4E9F8_PURLI
MLTCPNEEKDGQGRLLSHAGWVVPASGNVATRPTHSRLLGPCSALQAEHFEATVQDWNTGISQRMDVTKMAARCGMSQRQLASVAREVSSSGAKFIRICHSTLRLIIEVLYPKYGRRGGSALHMQLAAIRFTARTPPLPASYRPLMSADDIAACRGA